ncbi:CdaR family protein [Crassaminicella thermophila]|nr:CdaR family protein [Crassaminicella thermophila]
MKTIWKKIKSNIANSRFFQRNTTAKMISIVFAIVMWLYVMGEVNPQSIIELTNVEVQLLNLQDLEQSGLIVVGQKDFTVNVKIGGRRNDIYKIRPQDIVARADLRGFHKGVNSVPVEISTPANASIVDLSPKQIKITLDEVVKRQKIVMVQPIGMSAEGFEPDKASISPSEVIVEGPESLVNTVTMVIADVNVADKEADVIQRIPVKAVNREGKEVNGVEVKNKYVDVKLPILRIKEVPIVISYEGKVKEGFKITSKILSQDKVIVKGRKEIIEGITEIKAKPVNINQLDKSIKKEIDLVLPDGISIPYLEKKPTVFISVEKIEDKTFTFSKEEVKIENLKKDYVADLSKFPEKINFHVYAIESMIDKIHKEDIKLFIDGKDLEEGLYVIDIQYDLSKKVEKVEMIPEEVDLIIESIKLNEEADIEGNGL